MTNYEDVKQSFLRAIVKNPRLTRRFYDIFLASSPSIAAKFTRTDFSRQLQLLRHGISYAIAFAGNPGDVKSVPHQNIQRIRNSHDRFHYNIEPHLYPYWIEALVKTISEFDEKWNPVLERRWREVLQYTVNYIVEGYQGDSSAASKPDASGAVRTHTTGF